MKQIKSRLFTLLLLLGGLFFTACEMNDGDETQVSEFGAVKKSHTVDWKQGFVEVEILSNQSYDISLVDPDTDWATLDTEGLGGHVTGDTKFKVHYQTNDGFPRQAAILVSAGSRNDTVYVRQKGFRDPQLTFSTKSITVLGDGGQAIAQLATNLELTDLQQQISYTNKDASEWISDLEISNGFLILQTGANTDPKALRNARIVLTYRNGWNEKLSSTLYITQANALNKFGNDVTFAEVRDVAGVVNDDLIIEGRIISDAGNGNNGENTMKTTTSIDYTGTYRTAYIQNLDGTMGFMIKTVNEEDNIFERYSKVRILLKGAKVSQEGDPQRYTISGITSAMVLTSENGSATDLPVKTKFYNELTDDDVYTWVNLKDCELPVRKGSLTPINEGYARNCGTSRESKYPMLVRDIKGNAFYMLTNTTCKYRRDGQMLPYGSGTISGVIVHESHDRFVWMGEQDMGNLGRYQLRHLTRADIALQPDFANSFSALLTEYRYGKMESHVFHPTTGDNGSLTFTLPDKATGDAGWATSDPSYLGPIGNKANFDKTGSTSGIHTGCKNGNGVIEGGKQMCTSENTNADGKGNVSGADYSAWTNECAWWNTETDRSEAWLLKLSTQGISTEVLSLQVAMLNKTIGGPRYIRVDWSEHGDNNRDDAWNPISEFQLPDVVDWNTTQYWQSAGYKYVNIALPLDMLGREQVTIRFSAANERAGSKTDFDADFISTGAVAFSYIGVRYNK
ncbi:MAG: DUF5689 domain-containing protein [Alistipes sp.]